MRVQALRSARGHQLRGAMADLRSAYGARNRAV